MPKTAAQGRPKRAAPISIGHAIRFACRENHELERHQYCGDGNFVESVLKLKISVPSVSKSAIRGEKPAKDRKYSLVG